MKFYNLFIQHDGDSHRTFLGVFPASYCLSYWKDNAGAPGFHIYLRR